MHQSKHEYVTICQRKAASNEGNWRTKNYHPKNQKLHQLGLILIQQLVTHSLS